MAEATVSKKKKIRRSDYQYTVFKAMRNGDWITRLSFLIMGFGNIVRKQFVKGLSFLVLESIFIYFMIKNGASLLTDFFHLGGAEQEKVWNDAKGIFEYTQGDNSLLMLLYGVATVFIIFAFVCLWVVSVESAYRAQCLHDAGKKVPGFTDDIKSLFDKNLHMFLLPLPVLGIVVFTILPLVFMICMAFTNYSKLDSHTVLFNWVGLKNFEYLFTTSDAFVITRNTILYNVAFIVINTTLAIAVAIILSELEGKRKKVYQSAILLPNLLSTVIIGYLVFAFFSVENGLINNTILKALGKDPVSWYSEPKYWPFILVFVSAWKSVGYNCIVYLATLMGFDKSFYESAKIDGATRWQQIKYITLPLLRPTIIMLTMMAIGRIFYSDFGLFYQVPMNQGALYSTTNTIDTYVYRGLLQMGNVSMSAAAGVYQSIVGFILVLGANLLVRKIDRDSALI